MALTIARSHIPIRVDKDGVARIGSSHVTLDTVIAAYEQDSSAEEIVSQYPTLKLADVYHVIGYYWDHQADVNAYLAERARRRAEVRRENEARSDPEGVRARLLARREQGTDGDTLPRG